MIKERNVVFTITLNNKLNIFVLKSTCKTQFVANVDAG
jgi:hypothetical protein